MVFGIFSKKSKSSGDRTRYFPNKCYFCDHYVSALPPGSRAPRDASDTVNCPVGGRVRVQTGCSRFQPDRTATCGSCWNFSSDGARENCTIHGALRQWREFCRDAVKKDGA